MTGPHQPSRQLLHLNSGESDGNERKAEKMGTGEKLCQRSRGGNSTMYMGARKDLSVSSGQKGERNVLEPEARGVWTLPWGSVWASEDTCSDSHRAGGRNRVRAHLKEGGDPHRKGRCP